MTTKRQRLGDSCIKITKGTTPTTLGMPYSENGIPFIRVNNFPEGKLILTRDVLFISENTHQKLQRSVILPDDVLLSIAGTIGRSCVVPSSSSEANCNQAVCIIRPNTKALNSSFLNHWLRSDDALSQVTGGRVTGVISNLSLANVRNLEIPLPPLAEQKRIAGILDAADALRAKRRESLAQLDTLLQSTFLDLFGDPVTNPMGWEMGQLSDVVQRLDGGKNVAQSETPTDYRVLKVSAVTYGVYRPNESKYLPSEFDVPESYLVKKGDLLISRANTRELIGATAYVWETPHNIALPDKIWKFIWRKDVKIEPLFIYQLSQNLEFRRILGSRASGTSGSMKNIAKPKLLGLPIPLPPISLQRRFAGIVESVERQKARLRAHLAELDALFASLQSRAFNGEL